MGCFDALVARSMSFSAHNFSCVDSYVGCGCDTVEDTPFCNVSVYQPVG